MPRTFDSRYHPLLAMSDSGEQPNRGAILLAPFGKGMYVYTTLAFFRQLPAGVSGGARLFVNLLSLKSVRDETQAGSCARPAVGSRVFKRQPDSSHRLLAAWQGAAGVFREEFEKAHPGIDVQWVDMGSQEVLDRVRAERTTRREMSGSARRRKRLIARRVRTCSSPTSPAGLIPSAWKAVRMETTLVRDVPDARGHRVQHRGRERGSSAQGLGRGSRSEVEGQDSDPRSDRFRHDARDLRSDRCACRGEDGQSRGGYDWLRKLDANTREYVLNPTILYQKLSRQEGIITLWDMPDIATLQQRTGIPVGYVIPSSGTPVLVDGIAIVKEPGIREGAALL